MTRRHNPLRVKLDATYTAREIAERFAVDVRTVRKWISNGLRPIDRHVPHLFYGRHVRTFIQNLNKPYEPLGPGEFFCVVCKAKREPALGAVWLTPRSDTTADYTAHCSACSRKIHRRVRLSEIHLHLGSAHLIHEDERTHVSRACDCPRTPLLAEPAA